MLQHLHTLCAETDGRYASDEELLFFQDYLKTARLRFALYQKLQHIEPTLIQQILAELQQKSPDLLKMGSTDMTAKWQRDTVRTLRYMATAVLVDDADLFQERMLLWFQTIMKSFGAEASCAATYKTMQSLLSQTLTHEELQLMTPILEMSQAMLGGTQKL